jgi:phage gp37-like protein
MKDGYLARFGENIAAWRFWTERSRGRQVWRWQQSLQAKLLHGRERLAKEYESRDEIPQRWEWCWTTGIWPNGRGRMEDEAFQRAGRLRAVRSHPKRPLVLELARASFKAANIQSHRREWRNSYLETQQVRSWTEQELALLVPALKNSPFRASCKILPQVEQREKGEERSKLWSEFSPVFVF